MKFKFGICLEFGIWDLDFLSLGIGKHVQIAIDLFEGVGQIEDPNTDQKKTAHNGDHPHISFHSLKGGQE